MVTLSKEDMSDWVFHLTRIDRNKPDLDPFATLMSILRERRIRGGNGFIMEKRIAICFTETTLETLHDIFRRTDHGIRYRPYGIMILKYFAKGYGALPVIYQPRDHYEFLHETKKHLHVTYDLHSSERADCTWEREWRLSMDGLPLNPQACKVLVPDHATRACIGRILTEGEGAPGDPWDYQVLSDLDAEVPIAPAPES